MALIGWATQSRMDRQWGLLSRLSGHFLDVVAGLPTLKIFGRAKAQAESIRRITHDYRRATLRTLRIAFLSSFALELLATLSVALVAVTIGMRLVHGDMDLYTGLVILVLAPEAYLPLRQVGAQYHAAAEGLAAAEEVFAVLETPVPHTGTQAPPAGALAFEGVTVRYPGRDAPAVREATFTVEPGRPSPSSAPAAAARPRCSRRPWASSPRPRAASPSAGRTWRRSTGSSGTSASPGSPSARSSSPAPSRRTSGWPAPTPVRRRSRGPSNRQGRGSSSPAFPQARRRSWGRTAPGSPRASASGSPWPGRSSPTGRSCSSTSPPPRSTGRARKPSSRRYAGSPWAGRCSWWCTGPRCSPWPTGWCGSTR